MSMFAQFMFGLVSLSLLNFALFFMTWRKLDIKKRDECKADQYLSAITSYIQNNGIIPLSKGLPSGCPGVQKEEELTNDFRRAVENLLFHCHVQPSHQRLRLKNPVLTLFTIWNATNNITTDVFRNTLINWSMFMPKLNLVLFTNDSNLSVRAEDSGWTVFPIRSESKRKFSITAMFETVTEHFNSSFYGYANYETLFTDGLIDSLHLVLSKFDQSQSIFLSGTETGIEPVKTREASSFENIQIVSKLKGVLNGNLGAYFITSNSQFWKLMPVGPEVLVNGTGIEQIFKSANNGSYTMIDVSETVLALRQNAMPKDAEKIQKNPSDEKVLKYERKQLINTAGCKIWKSYQTLCGTIDIDIRDQNSYLCKYR